MIVQSNHQSLSSPPCITKLKNSIVNSQTHKRSETSGCRNCVVENDILLIERRLKSTKNLYRNFFLRSQAKKNEKSKRKKKEKFTILKNSEDKMIIVLGRHREEKERNSIVFYTS